MSLLLALLSPLAFAQSIPLKDLTPADFTAVTREFAANAMFANVTGAGTLGAPLSFEVGVLGGLTSTPNIDHLTKDATVPHVPNGLAYAQLTGPLGLTAEVGWLPRLGGKDFRFENMAVALKWTPTELFFAMPIDLAVRGQFVKTGLALNAMVDDVRARANFASKTSALEVRASKNLGILTPYLSVGIAQTSAVMNATGALVFDPTYTRDQRESTHVRGGMWNAGMELHLIILAAGLEYQRAFDADRFTAKLGFGF